MQKIPLQQQDMAQLTTQIKQWGLELGFQQVGISGVDLGEHPQHLQNWLDKGFHGDLNYMAAHGAKRGRPDLLEAYAQRVISVRMDYLVDKPKARSIPENPHQGVIARYALGRDYHKTLRRRLLMLVRKLF